MVVNPRKIVESASTKPAGNPSIFGPTDVNPDQFARLCEQLTDRQRYPHASDLINQVLVYDRSTIVQHVSPALMSELADCLRHGPGVFVVRGAFDDLSIIDRCTTLFRRIVEQEAARGENRGDHFGTNQRIWNSLQKTCLLDPPLFVKYYGNRVLAIASESWLGPGYRITAQMNNIKPGGAAQSPHRDYHLGFQSSVQVAKFPLHAQQMSQYLTLQGAIAHGDMSIESGPTQLLPFSQQYPLGYLAAEHPQIKQYFWDHHVQIPLAKGDALFFNPALFHAGGNNRSEMDRVANLIQVSSAFGRTMESIDHRAMIAAVYPLLQQMHHAGVDAVRIDDVIATVADGYAFPTNLDSDPPVDGNAPASQQQLIRAALDESCTPEDLADRLDRYDQRRRG